MTSNPPVAAMLILAAMAACVTVVFLFLLPQEELDVPAPIVHEHQDSTDTWRLLHGPSELSWRGEPGARYAHGLPTASSPAVPTEWTQADWSAGTRLRFCADGPSIAWSFEVRGDGVERRFVYASLAPCL